MWAGTWGAWEDYFFASVSGMRREERKGAVRLLLSDFLSHGDVFAKGGVCLLQLVRIIIELTC